LAHPKILVEAEQLYSEKKYEEAGRLYDQILAQNERHAYILAGMAQVFMHSSSHLGAAIALFRAAWDRFKEDGEKVPYELPMNLGITYKKSGQLDKARTWLMRALEIEETAASLSNYGQLFGETAEAEKGRPYLEKAVKLDPKEFIAHWNLALCLLMTAHRDNHWAYAWDEHDHGQYEGGPRMKRKETKLPIWDGTKGKKVLVYGEQGIGDEIMFASMIPDMMKDAEIILDCHPRLATLFEKSFGIKCYPTRKDKEADWIEVEKPDAIIAIGSLGRFYRRDKADFPGTPYLKADAAPKGDKFRVGISWTGGRLTQRVAKRTVPLSWWDSILMNNCEFVSLQYTDGAQAEIDALRAKLGHDVRQEPAATAQDYYELAKFVKSCDLIITVCTSLVHLAGALGVPTWVMVPKHPAWRYQSSGPMPWYKSVRLYRQPEAESGAWIPVVQQIALDLSDLLAKREQKAA
jgi:hypothetical protein